MVLQISMFATKICSSLRPNFKKWIQKRNFIKSNISKSRKTALYNFHIKNGGKIVEFCDYLLPVQYGSNGISFEHKHVRANCGIFDVSHMLQTKIYGIDKIDFIESLIVGDIKNLKTNTGTLSLFTSSYGGIIDDLICSKISEPEDILYIVSNAGCREKDFNHMKDQIEKLDLEMDIEIIDNALIALQGPKSSKILQNLTTFDLSKLHFMSTGYINLNGIDCRVTRCGYTGEDGFEISLPNDKVVDLCETLLNENPDEVKLAGLGARDSLRLEAGLCLYGNDITEETTPVEAMLSWTISKRRRETANFPGATRILEQLKEKPKRKRIGLISREGASPRQHCKVISDTGEQIGEVTSGCPSPTLKCNIAMAYVESKYAKIGTELKVVVRNKEVKATVSKMPFVKTNYYQ